MRLFDRYILVFFVLLIILIGGCKRSSLENVTLSSSSGEKDTTYGYDPDQLITNDFDQIKKRGYLTAIVDNSSTGMFLYRGEPMGYEYELLSLFAASIDLELRFDITPSIEDGFRKLNAGHGDILAYNLTVTKDRQRFIEFTLPHNLVRQVLVQRKPDNWRDMKLHEIEKTLLRNPIDLIGKEVYVRKGSAYTTRLRHLSEEIGGDILIIEEFEELETEALIEMVADRHIDYTVADEDVALVNARYHPNLDVKTAISFPQQIAWGVRKKSPQLLDTLNAWIVKMKQTSDYYALYDKYFKSSRKSKERVESDFFSTDSERLSPYDSLIKLSADKVGWDWKLLAAQISKESRFDPDALSWVGARGLMQIMPKTGQSYGYRNLYNPDQNLKAGAEHILWLQDVWSELDDTTERAKFVLASYNVGQGHVQDAARLAKKYGKNPLLWSDVAVYLRLKSKKKYYNDPVVKFGYCRGDEPVDYVNDIFYRYSRYLQMDQSASTSQE
ncbi:MAG: transporter substrate-binding domain-containing protein [Reichenbachiella sp.]|uniref:transglycosylase SLT domain-containing protein n=1 Tax=Reichenbachiella sp. TaxID=2184521 RepID=UPI0032660E55